jgi:hypothetical protein
LERLLQWCCRRVSDYAVLSWCWNGSHFLSRLDSTMADAATTFVFKDVLVILAEVVCALVTRPAGLPASSAARLGGMLQCRFMLLVSCEQSYRGGSL